MPNNNENDQPERKKVIFFKRAYPDVVQNCFYTKDNKKFRTKDGHDFIVKESKTPDTPVEPEVKIDYVEGATVIWMAEDGLNNNNEWVDRISGYVLTPRNASVVPVYNSEDKLLDFNQFGGMESNFKPGNIDYTIEIVTRDIANSKSESASDGLIFTSAHSSDGLHGFTFCQKNSKTVGIIQVNNNASQRVNHELSSFETNSLDTFTASTSIQALNGEVVKSYTSTPEHTSVLTLGCRKGTSGFRAKFKVHCIRYYPFKLTAEQIAHNRQVDMKLFNK